MMGMAHKTRVCARQKAVIKLKMTCHSYRALFHNGIVTCCVICKTVTLMNINQQYTVVKDPVICCFLSKSNMFILHIICRLFHSSSGNIDLFVRHIIYISTSLSVPKQQIMLVMSYRTVLDKFKRNILLIKNIRYLLIICNLHTKNIIIEPPRWPSGQHV